MLLLMPSNEPLTYCLETKSSAGLLARVTAVWNGYTKNCALGCVSKTDRCHYVTRSVGLVSRISWKSWMMFFQSWPSTSRAVFRQALEWRRGSADALSCGRSGDVDKVQNISFIVGRLFTFWDELFCWCLHTHLCIGVPCARRSPVVRRNTIAAWQEMCQGQRWVELQKIGEAQDPPKFGCKV